MTRWTPADAAQAAARLSAGAKRISLTDKPASKPTESTGAARLREVKAARRKRATGQSSDKSGQLADLAAARLRSEARHAQGPKRGRPPRLGAPGAGNRPKLPERAVLKACMGLLEAHPKVALWFRVNSGAVKIGDRYVKFAFQGASDLMGMMAGSGKFLAIECKATGGRMSDAQTAFLANVSRAGGYALCVDDPAYLASWLERI